MFTERYDEYIGFFDKIWPNDGTDLACPPDPSIGAARHKPQEMLASNGCAHRRVADKGKTGSCKFSQLLTRLGEVCLFFCGQY